MANQTGFTIESDYEYILGQAEGKVLQLEAVLQRPGDFLQIDLQHIADEMKSTAQYFAEMQGFNTGGNLYKHIEAVPEGDRIILRDEAQNPRLEYYAGHQEYGFHTRDGKFIEARPFLRPAMRAVQLASTGKLSSAALEVANFAGGMMRPSFNKHGTFGNNLGRIRAFYRSDNYTRSGLEKKMGVPTGANRTQTARNMGKSYSINRRDSSPSGFNKYSNGRGGYTNVRWDSPYTRFNTYKMERINSNWGGY